MTKDRDFVCAWLSSLSLRNILGHCASIPGILLLWSYVISIPQGPQNYRSFNFKSEMSICFYHLGKTIRKDLNIDLTNRPDHHRQGVL